MKTTSPKKFVKIHFYSEFDGSKIMFGSESILGRLGCSQARMDRGSTLVWNTWSYKKDITTLAQEHLVKTVVRVVFLSTREPEAERETWAESKLLDLTDIQTNLRKVVNSEVGPNSLVLLANTHSGIAAKTTWELAMFFFVFFYSLTIQLAFIYKSAEKREKCERTNQVQTQEETLNWLRTHSSVTVSVKLKTE